MSVPKGAEVLLETRLPYLDAAQRREVLRTTALPAGNQLMDGPEQWGRLNLFAAADGYGVFDADVRVGMDAARGGFSADDSWRNDIGGAGGLVKAGSGTLTLTGRTTTAAERGSRPARWWPRRRPRSAQVRSRSSAARCASAGACAAGTTASRAAISWSGSETCCPASPW